MAVVDGSAMLHEHRSPARAVLAVGLAAVALVGYFVFSSSLTVMRTDVCGQFVSQAPGQGWEASPPRGIDAHNPLLRIGFVDRNGGSGPVLHTLAGVDLPLQTHVQSC